MRSLQRLTRRALLAAPLIAALTALPGATTSTARADDGVSAEPTELDDEAPDEDFVWEDGDELEDGTTTDGFYRLRTRPGFAWVEGHFEGTTWVGPHWQPTAPAPAGQVWVPGHRGPDGYWVNGAWRPATRPGFVWVPAGTVDGVWVRGTWRPVTLRPGEVWVPGHWTPAGVWVDGHWRPAARSGYAWEPGHWRYGRWIPGFWRPTVAKPGQVWVAGYWGPRGRVKGYWRPAARPGHHWVAAAWVNGVWTAGRWVAGARPAPVVRRYRVHPVAAMMRSHDRRLWRAGKRQERHGKAQQRRGEALKGLGEATGSERLERKGERVERRGERNERRGERKQRRAK